MSEAIHDSSVRPMHAGQVSALPWDEQAAAILRDAGATRVDVIPGRAPTPPPLPPPRQPVSLPDKLKSRKFWITVLGVLAQVAVLVPAFHLPPQWAAGTVAGMVAIYVLAQAAADIFVGDDQPITPPPFGAQEARRQ